MLQTNLFTNQKQTHRLKEQTYAYLVRGDIVREFGIDMYTLYLNNQIEKKNLSYIKSYRTINLSDMVTERSPSPLP